MALEIPRTRLNIRQIEQQKRNVPIQEIIAIEGQNPLATGIETAGNVIGQALTKRAELRRQGEQLARMEKAYGLKEGELSGLDTETGSAIGKYVAESRKPTYVQQINPDGTANLLEVPAGGKFGGTVKVPIQPPKAKPSYTQENLLRSQFVNQSKDFTDTASAYQRVIDSSRSPSAAGDMALIFNYMKMLDPGSTVREGEFANAAASGSYGARIQAAANKVLTGQRLDDSMRGDFVARANDLYQGQLSRHKQREAEFQSLAESYGSDNSRRVTPNLATPLGGYGAAADRLRPIAPVTTSVPLTATNKKTNQKIISHDGGKTWQPAN